MNKNEDSKTQLSSPMRSSKKGRSSAYPSHGIEDSIDAVSRLNNQLGKGPFDRDSAARALGYKGVSGASALKISACTQFGLLMRSGNTYYVSDLARKILTPTSETERKMAIIEAVETPSLYSSLISTYTSQTLPEMLANILCRNYGIIENSAQKAVNIFRDSLEYAGLLKNGVVQSHSMVATAELSDEGPEAAITSNRASSTDSTADTIELEIPGVEAKIILSKKYAFALSMGKLATGISTLKEELEQISSGTEETADEKQE